MKRIVLALCLLALVGSWQSVPAQKLDPAKWTLTVEAERVQPGTRFLAELKANLEEGWYLYSPTTPPGGPIPTVIALEENAAVSRWELYQQKPVTKFDENFNIDTEKYDKEAVFVLAVTLSPDVAAGPLELTARVRYQMCTDKLCLPPVRRTATASIIVDTAAAPLAAALPPGFYASAGEEPAAGAGGAAGSSEPAAAGSQLDRSGTVAFLLVAFGFGLAAVFTPCVFPMIPITVSFFLNRQGGSTRGSLAQALVFCLGIITLFSTLGLAATAALGPFGIVQLGSNPWVNSFIALVFGVFGLSLLGAFEITLPSGVLTKLDRASQRGGSVGTLLMGLTFSLTAFACVGPFVGTLLAASLQAGGWEPLLGMVCFATGLASPFFLLALFPSYLQRLPKSGGWLARVKVVLGFIVLAAMFKYLSNIDQVMQWSLLTRERFLSVWVVLFTLAGLYLLGFLRLEGIRADEPLGVGRALTGATFLAFAISLVPGMFGGRLGELDAYVPPPASSGAFASTESARGGADWMKNQYPGALARASQEGKLVFVNFTGYACTNCHWMKANMFTRPEIASALDAFVLVELYTDGTDEASRANQKLQEQKFSTIAIPYYAILGPDERVLATFAGLTRDPAEFLNFLNSASAPR